MARVSNLSDAPVLRAIEPDDHAAVLELNHHNVAALAPMDQARLDELLGIVDRGQIVDVGGQVAGFVLTFPSGTAYDSPYYLAFTAMFGDDFYYLDRIVIGDRFRRRGLGSFVYDAVERLAEPSGRVALEVNTRPLNEVSMAFHLARGYREVDRVDGETKEVAMMTKDLP
jgi:predicted GNAT superfamily acetyltransferase